MDFEVEGVRT